VHATKEHKHEFDVLRETEYALRMAQEGGADEEEVKKLKGETHEAAAGVKEARLKSGYYERKSTIGRGFVDSAVYKNFTGLEKEVVFMLQLAEEEEPREVAMADVRPNVNLRIYGQESTPGCGHPSGGKLVFSHLPTGIITHVNTKLNEFLATKGLEFITGIDGADVAVRSVYFLGVGYGAPPVRGGVWKLLRQDEPHLVEYGKFLASKGFEEDVLSKNTRCPYTVLFPKLRELIDMLPEHRRRPLDTRANILAMMRATNAIAHVDNKGHRSKLLWFENFLIPAGQRPDKKKQGKGKGGDGTLDAFFSGAKKAKGDGSA